nr:hypothetical protein [Angustibacter aerolatus]
MRCATSLQGLQYGYTEAVSTLRTAAKALGDALEGAVVLAVPDETVRDYKAGGDVSGLLSSLRRAGVDALGDEPAPAARQAVAGRRRRRGRGVQRLRRHRAAHRRRACRRCSTGSTSATRRSVRGSSTTSTRRRWCSCSASPTWARRARATRRSTARSSPPSRR